MTTQAKKQLWEMAVNSYNKECKPIEYNDMNEEDLLLEFYKRGVNPDNLFDWKESRLGYPHPYDQLFIKLFHGSLPLREKYIKMFKNKHKLLEYMKKEWNPDLNNVNVALKNLNKKVNSFKEFYGLNLSDLDLFYVFGYSYWILDECIDDSQSKCFYGFYETL